VAHRLDDIAAAGLALGSDHCSTLADPAKRLTEVSGTTHEGHAIVVLRDVMLIVCRRQNLALVDEVDAHRLEHPRFLHVSNAHLCHHRDRDGLLDLFDHLDRAHSRDTAISADIRRNPFECHDCASPRVLGDLCLFGIGDIHDHTVLHHLGEPDLELEGLRTAASRPVSVSTLFS